MRQLNSDQIATLPPHCFCCLIGWHGRPEAANGTDRKLCNSLSVFRRVRDVSTALSPNQRKSY